MSKTLEQQWRKQDSFRCLQQFTIKLWWTPRKYKILGDARKGKSTTLHSAFLAVQVPSLLCLSSATRETKQQRPAYCSIDDCERNGSGSPAYGKQECYVRGHMSIICFRKCKCNWRARDDSNSELRGRFLTTGSLLERVREIENARTIKWIIHNNPQYSTVACHVLLAQKDSRHLWHSAS